MLVGRLDLRSRSAITVLLATITLGFALETGSVPITATSIPEQNLNVLCLSPSPADLSQTLVEPSATNGTTPGNIAPDVRNRTAAYIADMSPASRLRIELVFKLRNANQFQQCLNSISDPSSPEYRHFLNSTTLQPYLPTPGQRASVANYLALRGFDVNAGPSPLVLTASASVATLEHTFGVRIGLYKGFYSADSDPAMPGNLASLLTGVFGLDNITRVRREESPCSGPYCPQGLQVGYSFTSLYSGGFNGAGQKVAIVDAPGDPDTQKALNTFSSQYGLPATTITFQYPDGKPSSYDPTWGSEAAMDVEAIHAVAPGASIILLYDNASDLMNAVDFVASNHLANIVSNSWTYDCISPEGSCTDSQLAQQQPAFVASVHSRLAIDVAQGLTILFASGDEGAQPDGTTFGPEFPASDPNVLAVGATSLGLAGCGPTNCTGYESEAGAFSSGGGYSSYFAEPPWQLSTIGVKSGRAVPDISMLGSLPGIWVYSTSSDKCLSGGNSAGWFSCTGTSLSTPLWAGFLAIVEQESGGSPLGNFGPRLYQVASSAAYSSDFHDIVNGFNGYNANIGWDPVTGWGTPIAASLAPDLAVHPSLTLTNSGGVLTNQGNAGSTQINVNINLTIFKPVALACVDGLPARASCSFNPSSALPNYTSTLTINTEPSTPAGVYNITVVGTGDLVPKSTSFDLIVNQHQQSCTQTSIPSTYNCPLSFVEGWNLFSLPVVPVTNTTFLGTVAGIFGSDPQFGFMSNVTDVFTYTNGVWQSCAVAKQGSGVNVGYTCAGSLKNLVDGKGYWVYAKAAFTLNNANSMAPTWGGLIGSVIPSLSLPPTYALNAGWNLVGYKPQPDATATENVTTYLQSLNGHYDLANVWIYDNVDQVWVRATPDTQLKPSEAMWIFMNSPATLRP